MYVLNSQINKLPDVLQLNLVTVELVNKQTRVNLALTVGRRSSCSPSVSPLLCMYLGRNMGGSVDCWRVGRL